MDHVLNWLWQGSVVGLATGVILRLLTRARAPFRYVLCWIALGVVLTLPVLPLLVATAPLQEPVAGAMPSEVMFAVPQAWWTSTTIVLSAWALWSAVHCVRMATALRHLRRALDARIRGIRHARCTFGDRRRSGGLAVER